MSDIQEKSEEQIKKDIADAQSVELQMLKVAQGICKKYNLRYYAIGGTCIGAIRHKGFIPWDDDIDIAMPFEDYKKFKEVAPKEMPEHYALYDHFNNKHARMFFTKMHDESTTGIPKKVLNYPDRYMGISIDIMPLYGMPKGKFAQKITMLKCFFNRLNNQVLRFPISYQGSLFTRLYWIINSPKKLFLPYNHYAKKSEKLAAKYRFDESDKIMFGWRGYNFKRLAFYQADFNESEEVPFEDTVISVPKGYDRYLTQDFGDYMVIPPKEKQIAHVWGILDLTKSYKYYKELKEKE